MNCSYEPLAEILPVILKEEIGHVGYGGSKAAELMATGDESRERLQNALNYWYVKALDMFGRAESKRSERYRFWSFSEVCQVGATERLRITSHPTSASALITDTGVPS